jgi:hypothetical protein
MGEIGDYLKGGDGALPAAVAEDAIEIKSVEAAHLQLQSFARALDK